jgi:pseudouridine synthase
MAPGPQGDDRGVRLQRVLARAGIASRRHAEALIQAGRVVVNGRVVTELGTRVDPARDRVEIDGQPVEMAGEPVYVALHKPPGYVTTTHDPQGRPTVMALVPSAPGLFPVGRLDAESDGLLLLTTDGEWAQRLSHPRYGCAKEYLVKLDGALSEAELERLRRPMRLGPDEWTTGSEVEIVERRRKSTRLRMVLHEGRNRQIRRMMEQLGRGVLALRRVRVGCVELGGLPAGRWRYLTAQEISSAALGAERDSRQLQRRHSA